jgi:hypothetical protein
MEKPFHRPTYNQGSMTSIRDEGDKKTQVSARRSPSSSSHPPLLSSQIIGSEQANKTTTDGRYHKKNPSLT